MEAIAPVSSRAERQAIKREIRSLIDNELDQVDPMPIADGMQLLPFQKNGGFCYDTYRQIQELGNKQLLSIQWVPRPHIFMISERIKADQGAVSFGLCHGSRRGLEQEWFRRKFPAANVIGTEISDTATTFPNTIKWDFHQVKPEWIGTTDFIYSNSWTHTYDPAMMFPIWACCLKPGGRMYLDHSKDQNADVSAPDAFGARLDALITYLDQVCSSYGQVIDVMPGAKQKKSDQINVVIFEADPIPEEPEFKNLFAA